MKRFLSWIVFVFVNGVLFAVGAIAIALFFALLSWLGDKHMGVLVFVAIAGGGLGLWALSLPFTIGIPYVIMTSETICCSKKGTRYKVFAIFQIIGFAAGILGAIFGWNSFSFHDVYGIIYGTVLLLTYPKYLGETL